MARLDVNVGEGPTPTDRKDAPGRGQAPEGRQHLRGTGRRFHLGTNKEVFGAEVYAMYQALNIIDRRQENGHKYTVFVDSTAVIERVRSDSTGPGQRFAVAAIEACTRLLPRTDRKSVV